MNYNCMTVNKNGNNFGRNLCQDHTNLLVHYLEHEKESGWSEIVVSDRTVNNMISIIACFNF